MKTIDVSKQVMDEVVHFEKKRSLWWLGRFLFILLVLLAAGISFLWIAVTQIFERQTLELLTLFTQNREIIGEFWQDTLLVFWEELPQKKLAVGLIALFAVGAMILVTRKQLRVLWKKMRQLAKY